ncbi:hypothetical protein PITCH_A800015 [uncultured Desulfobacterium sp.]|uniref:HEAT repeat domain-containing protein n=1 Tax=uncultured Desulfobacterium sp. TaxID=201089 RepID=A0A445N2Z1_9BACT|nr:hypothetical protein PITCH_A800015 [uncultured Desulfobacterium sp.]
MDFSDSGLTSEELQGVKDFIASFLIGVKNYCLYPENHSISQKSVANSAMRLEGFLKDFHDLRLDVQRDRLLFKNVIVFQEATDAENLATILFRDGIQWIRFSEGFGFQELQEFFRILKENKNWNEDAEGDIVTALWEANFSNLRYMAVDVYWESEPLIDYSTLNAQTIEGHHSTSPDNQQIISPVSVLIDSGDSLLKLTEEEAEVLNKMISEEEKRDCLNDLLFIVFALLNDRDENNDLASALQFLEGEVQASLSQGDFKSAYRLISGVEKMHKGAQNKESWALSYLDQFFLNISNPKTLSVVPSSLRSIDAINSEDLKLLNQFFMLLHPKAICSLALLLSETRSLNIRQNIQRLITFHAQRDMGSLEVTIKKANDSVVERLVPVLGQLEGERPFQIIIKLLRHQSAGVRKQAIKQLKNIDGEATKWLFALAEDPDESVRNAVLTKLGKSRNQTAEGLLLKYLEKRQYTISDHKHLLACYRALGRCGSSRCINFLQEALFSRAWFLDFGKSVHRIGAIVALVALGTNEANELLKKASNSLFPAVRLAYRKALEVSR